MPRLDALPALCCFAALLLAVTLLMLAASGHFPRRNNRADAPGALLLWAALGLGGFAVVAGLVASWILLPGPAAVIAGGLAVLAGPLVLQHCPDRFVDGAGALTIFSGAAFVFAAILFRLAGWAL
ncbi:MAG TPA: hypothetical protein VG270_14410 [Pseudolabrys sp.]|jgi:hypothetical protein|nr:hypothetical protein [Pseudolabrys sp.]